MPVFFVGRICFQPRVLVCCVHGSPKSFIGDVSIRDDNFFFFLFPFVFFFSSQEGWCSW